MPHNSLIGATPVKALMGHKPNVSHLIVFGSKAWAKIPTDQRKSFQGQSRECILLGYADDAKAYKLMDLATKKCFIECSVQFEEDQVHNPQQAEAEEGIISHPFPFADDNVLTDVSYSEDEDQDDHEHDIEI